MKHDTYYKVRELMESGITSGVEIAKKLNVSERQVRRHIAKLKKTGFDPQNQRSHHNPQEQLVSGYSTLVRMKNKDDSSLGPVLEWVKTNVSLSEQLDKASVLVDALMNEVKPIGDIKYEGVKKPQKDTFTVLPLGDPHFGLKAWKERSLEDWDLDIAERVYGKVVSRVLKASPDTEEVIVVNTGDFFHADNAAGVTTRSGHKLDIDQHHGRWLDVGARVMRMILDAALKKYKKVHFVNVPGNHDDILGRALGTMMEHVYLNNKRFTIQKGDNPYQYAVRGSVLLGFAHGNHSKIAALPGKMAMDMPEAWGKTSFRVWITGHLHHTSKTIFKEFPGCSVETVGILAPKDGYGHGGCFGANRTLQTILYNSKIGYESARFTEIVRKDD